ncbi:MAG: Gfo/Idh/MocA family oxidoreductase [Kiritimatiellaeota bacterium]|nr:Gfo/Idh/MocA family oxidoreductase [Kiritimatiellota bacterium]
MKKVRFGVMGAGGIAFRKTIPGMLEADNCELVAVMDVAGVERIAAEFNTPRAYTCEAELLADPEVEAVYIATPAHLHRDQIVAAAERGKHILCEKPLTLTLEQTHEAVSACRSNGVYLQEGYMMKFHGAHQTIRDLIAAGRLGRIVYMRAQLSCWYPPIEGAWRQDPALGGGGSLIDMATHLYDLLEFFAGPIKRVAALTGNLVQDYKSEDAATTLLEFESGAHATVDTFFCIPDESSRTRLEVYGSQGSVLTEGTIGQSTGGTAEGIFGLGDSGYDAAQDKDVIRQLEPIDFPKINPYTAECSYFADCILEGRPPTVNDADNALHIMRVTELAYASAREGRFFTV